MTCQRSRSRIFQYALPCLVLGPALATAQAVPDLVLKNATVMTASHGTIEHGTVWVHNGKIAGVGATVSAPASATVIDAAGKFITPGIIDPHSHSALGNDVNEATSPVTPSMMIDAFDNSDKALYQALAGGVTTELLLHGSANMIGGQSIVIKNKSASDATRCSSPTLRAPSSSPRARTPSASMVQETSCRPPEWATSR